ncbi:Dnaj heat shock amino-terminal domain protein [Thalictrum thalictroides]|uniref:Dnaj heat shock amino-terminal domain protein n=1 Tax=Thalictrum thalictroides TaxID=46969 RepID=A0A7J6WEZ4_THATH|nr:Dnaj heat shock amino-terminal domain protein [Thalictrum thalictroides]
MARTRTTKPPKPNLEEEEHQLEDQVTEKEVEAIRLKTLAEQKYKCFKLKSALKYAKRAQHLCPNLEGISDMITSFNILYIYSKSSSSSSSTAAGPDWYSILQVEPFSHINSIKKQYKKLALILHPDKNTCIASEEAFKRVSEAHQLLSDKIRRKDYDLKLRIALQSQVTASKAVVLDEQQQPVSVVDTFWTACSTCALFHQFDRKYVGHRLICPSCKKSFLAEEVLVEDDVDDDNENYNDNDNDDDVIGVKQKESRVRSTRGTARTRSVQDLVNEPVKRSLRISVKRKIDIVDDVSDSAEKSRFNLRSRTKKVEGQPEMTLAQMQLEAKRKLQEKVKKLDKMKVKDKEETNKNEKVRVTEREIEKRQRQMEKEKERMRGVVANLEKNGNLEVMVVEDSDFYDFDRDRTERCVRKAQVWAIYDDDDGMPRHYGLIDEVESVNPFVVKMSWLDMENTKDERLICWEKAGIHTSCGRFKVSKKIVIDSVNVFSHLVLCERVAREVYCIYPRKGSIWALYSEKSMTGDDRNQMSRDTRSYDIVISLTSYSEMHGLSMAYLEKVEGFKTIFKRREVGCHAIIWLEKDNFRLFSHQIPAKKLSGTEARDLPKDCWELDPASLPQDMLTLGWER